MDEGRSPENKQETMDSVDALRLFIERECMLTEDRSTFARKDELYDRFVAFCLDCEVEPPGIEILGSILRSCYPVVISGSIRASGRNVGLWLNVALKPSLKDGGQIEPQ